MATQAERRATTRARIIESATGLFIERGYHDTSIADILEVAAVSRGALYHHFGSKEDVFAAVFVSRSTDAVRRASQSVSVASSPLERLVEACTAWLDVVADPAFGRILLDEGPAALGWQRCRTLEESTSLGAMRRGVAAAVDSGEIRISSVAVTARLINAIVAEAALGMSADTDGERSDAAVVSVTEMIRGLGVG